MPIIDKELVNETPMENMKFSNQGIGDFLLDIVKINIAEHGDSQWMHDSSTGKTMNYTEMVDKVTSMASALKKRGLKAGECVLLMASNYIELAISIFSVMKAGGACVSLTLNLFPEDIKIRASTVRAKFVVTDNVRVEKVLNAVKDLDFVQEVFIIGQAEGCTPIGELFNDDGSDCPERSEIDMDSMAWLMYSSGTTGEPKGIVHTHRTLTTVYANRKSNVTPGLRMLLVNYLINSGGTMLTIGLTLSHSSISLISKYDDYNLLETIHQVQPILVSIFPSQIAMICRDQNLDQFDLSSVAIVLTMGSCIYPKYETEIFYKFPNMVLLSVTYAMSESLSIASTPAPTLMELFSFEKEQAIENHIVGSAGKVAPYIRLKIIDEVTGEKLGPNEIGEICAKSPYTMKEYLNNPKATAETIKDGYIHTGDKGYYDDNENLFVIGRFKELIKYRMAHVVPSNIEKQMMTHPDVEEVGVVGQPDECDGELPLAFVVLRKGATATAEELITYTNGLVIEEEKLRGGVRFIDQIPRNELGKIVRPKLKKLL